MSPTRRVPGAPPPGPARKSRSIRSGAGTGCPRRGRWCACRPRGCTAASPSSRIRLSDHTHRALVTLPVQLGRDPAAPVRAPPERRTPAPPARRARADAPRRRSPPEPARRRTRTAAPQQPTHPGDLVSGLLRLDHRAALATAASWRRRPPLFSGTRSPSATGGSRLPSHSRGHAPAATTPAPQAPGWHPATLSPSCPTCCGMTPRSRATSAIGLPVSITICTASALKLRTELTTLLWHEQILSVERNCPRSLVHPTLPLSRL